MKTNLETFPKPECPYCDMTLTQSTMFKWKLKFETELRERMRKELGQNWSKYKLIKEILGIEMGA